MSKFSKRLLDDNEKLALMVREFVQGLLAQISCYHNIMAGSKDNLESDFHLAYQKPPKVQPPVAQIGRTHRPIVFQNMHLNGGLDFINAEATMLAAIIKKNFEGVGV